MELHFVTAGELESGFTVFRVSGELDSYGTSGFREGIAGLCGLPAVAIDLTGVPFIDSAGLGALVGGVRRIREAGGMAVICGTRPGVRRVLEMTGFDRVAPLFDTPAEAAAQLLHPAGAAS